MLLIASPALTFEQAVPQSHSTEVRPLRARNQVLESAAAEQAREFRAFEKLGQRNPAPDESERIERDVELFKDAEAAGGRAAEYLQRECYYGSTIAFVSLTRGSANEVELDFKIGAVQEGRTFTRLIGQTDDDFAFVDKGRPGTQNQCRIMSAATQAAIDYVQDPSNAGKIVIAAPDFSRPPSDPKNFGPRGRSWLNLRI